MMPHDGKVARLGFEFFVHKRMGFSLAYMYPSLYWGKEDSIDV